MTSSDVADHDLIGVGFGPANLALAIAVHEHNHTAGQETVRAAFAERQPRFGWHRGMLLDGATMQVSFLKDLATMRNPTSAFGFLPYLHERGRLVDFINHKTMFPTRLEFHDYLEWAAAQVRHDVHYGTAVRALRPLVGRDGTIAAVEVVATDGRILGRTRNVVLGVGLQPHLPEGVHVSERVWHSNDLLSRLGTLSRTRHDRFLVVGAGQSAAEVVEYLHRTHPHAEICAVHSRYGYSPADDSPFANRIFDPGAVDHFYDAPDSVKQTLLAYHGNTNYAVVDIDLIDELYRRVYAERVSGRGRLRIMNMSRVVEVQRLPDGVRARVDGPGAGEPEFLHCDALIFATGYRPADLTPILGDLAGLCVTDDQGRLQLTRDYRVRTDPALRCGIYLQGGTEHSHGLSSSLLSNSAIRAGEILRSLLTGRNRREGKPADPRLAVR
ncbi:lysine N(6)-hydroxylase/L-ornithine N(5)-oxygenase family protein [Streptosporangium sp. CA-135522]|uniref:lysine N(6)-hydroxylase/L-ornithine N(5)-oxygenase family protein n=1 Tax=Streptosporangium sp. CA-135522 TaxID=3240072 RepID=UPI003D91858B